MMIFSSSSFLFLVGDYAFYFQGKCFKYVFAGAAYAVERFFFRTLTSFLAKSQFSIEI